MECYKCNRCGYETNKKGNLLNHFNKKNVCKPVLSDLPIEQLKNNLLCAKTARNINCISCGDSFYHEKELTKHACKVSNDSIAKYLDEIENMANLLIRKVNILRTMTNPHVSDNQIAEVETKKEPKKETKVQTKKHETSQCTNITDFWNANTRFLTTDEQVQIRKARSKEDVIDYVNSFIQRVHFNPEHPENHNVLINKNADMAFIKFHGIGWKMQTTKQTIETLINKGIAFVMDFIDESNENGDIVESTSLWENVHEILENKGAFHEKLHATVMRTVSDNRHILTPLCIQEIESCGKEMAKFVKA